VVVGVEEVVEVVVVVVIKEVLIGPEQTTEMNWTIT